MDTVNSVFQERERERDMVGERETEEEKHGNKIAMGGGVREEMNIMFSDSRMIEILMTC